MAGGAVEATMVRRHRFSVCTFVVSARIFHTKHSALSLAGSVFRVGAGSFTSSFRRKPESSRNNPFPRIRLKPEGAQNEPCAHIKIAWSDHWRSRVLPIWRPLTGICRRRIYRLTTSRQARGPRRVHPATTRTRISLRRDGGTGASWTMCSENVLNERCAKITVYRLRG